MVILVWGVTPRERNATITAIMELKDLNKMEFSALVGSLINYEIVLRSKRAKSKSKEKKKRRA